MQHLPSDERRIIKGLVSRALGRGYVVSVNDGEEWSLVRSSSSSAICASIGLTDTTTLVFRDGARRDDAGRLARVGSVFLVHGNGDEVVCDCTDIPEILSLVAPGGVA